MAKRPQRKATEQEAAPEAASSTDPQTTPEQAPKEDPRGELITAGGFKFYMKG